MHIGHLFSDIFGNAATVVLHAPGDNRDTFRPALGERMRQGVVQQVMENLNYVARYRNQGPVRFYFEKGVRDVVFIRGSWMRRSRRR